MLTAFTSTTGLLPILLSLIGILLALQYLKGAAEFSKAIRLLFFGFLFLFISKCFVLFYSKIPDAYFYFSLLSLHLCSAFFIVIGSLSFKSSKSYKPFSLLLFAFLLVGLSWYVVMIISDGRLMTLGLVASSAAYAVLATTLWRRKMLKNSIGFVITGWFCIFLMLYNLLVLMPWGKSLTSPSFETFLYIAIMCGWILISNNLMAHQFDLLEQVADESKERLRLMIQMSPFPIIISRLKDDQLMLINNKAGTLFGLDVKRPGNFKTVDYFAEPEKRQELLAKLEKHPVVDDFEFLVKPRKGNPFWLLLSARVIDFEYEIALYMAFQDITDRKKKELQLFDQATKDPLTKCYNRRQFEELAKNEIQRSRRYGHPFCLFMIDADHFKNVNDTHGHAVGDLVLQALADCCRRTLRESDIIARFGGEEFVILLPEAEIANAHRVAERLRIKISKLVVKNEQNKDVTFTVSIGLVSSKITDDVTEMLKLADESLYVAKENGRNQVIVYDETGPNKDIAKPTGEDIDKIMAEPLFYFKPEGQAPSVKVHDNEPQETGVVGLSGETAHQEEDSLDYDEDEFEEAEGVSLNSLYDEDEDDGFVANTRTPVPPPVAVPFYETEEDEELLEEDPFASSEEDVFSSDPFTLQEETEEFSEEPLLEEESLEDEPSYELPQESYTEEEEILEDEPSYELPEESYTEEEEVLEDEPSYELPEESYTEEEEILEDEQSYELPEESYTEEEEILEDEPSYELPQETYSEEEEEVLEDEQSYELPQETYLEEEDVSEEDIDALLAETLPEEELSFEPPVVSMPTPPPVAPPVVEHTSAPVAPVMKKAPMKKIAIKMPTNMVKIPKMPSVVRVKIPKPLNHQEAPLVAPPTDKP